MDPQEVRRLVEEGTGLDNLRDRIALQETEVAQSRARLEGALLESKSVEREIELLQGDLSRLKRKRELLEEQGTLEYELNWAALEDLTIQIEKTKGDIEDRESGLVNILDEQADIQSQIGQQEEQEEILRSSMENLQLEIGHINANIEQKDKELARAQGDSKKQVAELKLIEGELREEKGKKDRLKQDLERISAAVEQYLEENRVQEERINEIVEERSKIRDALTAFAEWNAKRSEAHGTYRALQVEIEGKDLLLRSIRERLQVEEAELHAIESKASHLWDTMEKADERELANTKSQLERKIAALNEDRFRASSATAQLQKEIDEIKTKLSEVSERIPSSVRELKNAVVEHKLKSVQGPIVELISESDEMAPAIEAVLSEGRAFAFVTRDVSDFQLLQKLRDKTNAPSPVILLKETVPPIRPDLPSLKGIDGWLWEIMDLDDELAETLKLAIGDYVLTSSFRSAIKMGEKHGLPAVSRDGRVVCPDEFKLVSSPKIEPTGLVSTTPLTSRLEQAEKKLLVARKNVTSVVREIEDLTAQREEVVTLLSQITKWSSTWDRRKELLQSIPELQERIAVIDEELKTLQASLGSAERDLRELDNTQPPERSRLVGQDSALKIKLRKVQGDRSKSEKRLEFAKKDESQKRTGFDKAIQNEKMLSERVSELRGEIKAANDSSSDLLEEIEDLKASRNGILEKQKGIRQSMKETAQTLKTLSQRLVELNLVVKDKRLQVVQAKRQLTNMQYEHERLEDLLKGKTRPETLRPVDTVRSELVKLRHILDDYQDVSENVAHTESKLKGRLTELTMRVAELTEELDEAEATVKSIRDQYLHGMNEALDELESEVNRILGTVEFPGSVKFKLDKQDGQYGVQFKTRIKTEGYGDLSAGSGGERSLIAISMILALQRSNPAPVYVMDEVDTFLDATNTEFVSRLFHDASRRSQFILLTPAKSTHLLKHADKILGVVSPNGVEPSVVIESPTFKAQ
jgi:chromosome segregation ATPase